MPITVAMIEEKEFKTKVRGYDPVEVDEFLDDICDEMIEMQGTIQTLREQLKQKTAELAAASSFAPLPVAPIAPPAASLGSLAPMPLQEEEEALPADIVTAQQLLEKTQKACDEVLADAQKRAEDIIKEAEDMVPDGEKRRGYLRTLQAEATRLTHLVENVLAYSRVERGSARARVEETTAAALAARIVPRLEERVAAAGATLAVELPEDVGVLDLRTDATAVEQILFNLVDNACKYALGPEGSPPLQVRFAAPGAMLAVEVCDHGPGVGPAERKRLFRPFSKSAEDAANSKPGIGLGLSLSLRLARALGGKLELVDRKDQPGACFRLLLPLRPSPAR